jgi:hypothetical protein
MGTSAIITEVFCGFPQSFQGNAKPQLLYVTPNSLITNSTI